MATTQEAQPISGVTNDPKPTVPNTQKPNASASADTAVTTTKKDTTEEEKDKEIIHVDHNVYNILKWAKENESCFVPPICNKLMFGGQLKIMFVGGPNTRKDFHIDCGDEFFFQMRGNIQLPIVEKGSRKIVMINEGDIFLLPGCIPHSPQRPENNSLGLVIERERVDKEWYKEMDALRWYKEDRESGELSDDPLFERWFFCTNLGKDLVPVVREYEASEEFKTGECTATSLTLPPPVKIDTETETKQPFNIMDYVEDNLEALQKQKRTVILSTDQTEVCILTGNPFQYRSRFETETWIYVMRGDCAIKFDSRERQNMILDEGCCLVVSNKSQYMLLIKDNETVVMTVTMAPVIPPKPKPKEEDPKENEKGAKDDKKSQQ